MSNFFRTAAVASASLVVATMVTPAFATTPVNAPTSLNARAAKTTVAPRHKDTVYLTLRSKKVGVNGEAADFLVRSRRDTVTGRWSAWQSVAATATTGKGHYRISVTLPKLGKGKKEQYEVKFSGDKTKHLSASRSQVLTITAS